MLGLIILLFSILVLSVWVPRINAGLIALTSTLLLAPILLKTSASNALVQTFPTHLFVTLFGVTFFFTALNSTQIIERLLRRILNEFSQSPRAIPVLLFFTVAILTASGLGNIAAVALIAPLAIPLADSLGFSKTLMSLLVVGAANAASFSPLALPGIFIHSFIHKSSSLNLKISADTMQWILFLSVFVVISLITAVGFFLFGGLHWWKAQGSQSLSIKLEQTADESTQLTRPQRTSAWICAGLLTIFLLTCLFNMPFLTQFLPTQWHVISQRFSDVGVLGWLGCLALVITKSADLEESIKKIPWSTLLLVCGMSTFIELLSRLGLSDAVASPVQKHIPLHLLTLVFSSLAALISAFASSVGVALPLFMPLIEGVSANLSASLTSALVISIAIGSHLVDASPLSTLGALCLAQVDDAKERNKLYRNLLIWGLAMIPVAGLAGFFIFLSFS